MPWTFYNSSGQQLKSGETAISNLDIDGATDIGADIVDADLFIIDDGAGGTDRKTAASRSKTYAGTTQAVQSDIESETNQDTYVPPDLMKHHRGVAKAWCTTNAAGSLEAGSGVNSYNTDSITDTGTGDRTWVIDTDFADGIWTAVSTTDATASHVYLDSIQVGSMRIRTETSGGSLADKRSRQVAFGDQ